VWAMFVRWWSTSQRAFDAVKPSAAKWNVHEVSLKPSKKQTEGNEASLPGYPRQDENVPRRMMIFLVMQAFLIALRVASCLQYRLS
jgi:hypothetical protein